MIYNFDEYKLFEYLSQRGLDLYHYFHKLSISYGYKNKIDPNIIGGIDNCCITKRNNNSSKGIKCEIEYKNPLN